MTRRRTLLAIGLLLALTGCTGATTEPGGAPSAGPELSVDATEPADADTTDRSESAFTVDNCGFEVRMDTPPRRVVTIKSSTTEMMLALGLADRIVGAAFLDGPIPEEYGDVGVPVLAERVPGFEAVLATEPDLVYAGWESNFGPEGAGERDQLAELGVASYVSPAACKGAGYQPDPLTFEEVFAEIHEAGDLFGVPAAAAALVEEQRAALAAIEPHPGGPTALWYSSGSDIPYVGAGIGAPQMIMDAVGLTNIVADVHDTWASVSWEEVVAREPDVIVLVDSAWNTAEHKIGVLEGNPATSALDAVRKGRYLVVPFAATEAGVRNVAAAADLADQLAELMPPESG